MGRLFVVATPIGNLEDLTLRARRVLSQVPLVAAEDTRVARTLLEYLGLHPRLVSYNDENRARRIPELLIRLQQGDVALVTDAGTPAISDPGAELVAAARAAGHQVVAVPGPSALAAAISVAGIVCSRFCFAGFLPRRRAELARLLAEFVHREEALVAFEAPTRLRATLAVLNEVLPARRLAVCRELTKLHEEVFTGTAAQALEHFQEIRGEIVLVIEGGSAAFGASGPPIGDEEVLRYLAEMRRLGLTRAQAAALLASIFRLPRRRVYRLWIGSEPAGKGEDVAPLA